MLRPSIPFDDIDPELPFRTRLELFVYRVEPAEADELMMQFKESRGAVALLLEASEGHILFIGSGYSGTSVALATLGFQVTVLDTSEERLRFAAAKAADLVPGSTQFVTGGLAPALPFADRSFDVTIMEDGLPSPSTGWGFGMDELRRVTRDELFVVADNRLGYKRSTGRRGRFQRSLAVLASETLRPTRGEATLPTTRRRVAGPEFSETRAYSLYPHAREFSHVVALDSAYPQLTIGRREKQNRIKMIGHRLGLFRWLTPSFAIHGRRRGRAGVTRLDRMLAALAKEIGEPVPRADIVVATRSNDCIVHTAPVHDRSGKGSGEGYWTLHVPLAPPKREMKRRHHSWLVRLQEEHPGFPAAEPLYHGTVEGTEVAVERRLAGQSGTDITGDQRATRLMFLDAARDMASLLDASPTRITEEIAAKLFTPRFECVERLVRTSSTAKAIRRMHERVRERFVGAETKLGVYHADFRGKHLQLDDEGHVTGYHDWGASEASFLPFCDLLHLVVHQRKQEVGGLFGDVWRTIQDPSKRRPYEQEAIDAYVEHSGLDARDVAFYLETYPLYVAGMAEKNWDYSRPDWVHRQFGM